MEIKKNVFDPVDTVVEEKIARKNPAEKKVENLDSNETFDKSKEKSGCDNIQVKKKMGRPKLERKKISSKLLESSSSNNETVIELTKEKNISKEKKTIVEKKSERKKKDEKILDNLDSNDKSKEKSGCEKTQVKKKMVRPKLEKNKKVETSDSNKDTVKLTEMNTSAREEIQKKSIVNSTLDTVNKLNELSITSFNEFSTIKPPPKKPEPISIHKPIFGDRSIITLQRADLIEKCGITLADEILGNERCLTFSANSELFYEPITEDQSLEMSESDDDIFLRDLTNKRGKLVIIRKK